jgi:hypothetical protein
MLYYDLHEQWDLKFDFFLTKSKFCVCQSSADFADCRAFKDICGTQPQPTLNKNMFKHKLKVSLSEILRKFHVEKN